MSRIIPSAISPRSKKAKSPLVAALSAGETRTDFEDCLRQMFWNEKALAGLLPKLSNLATSYELTSAIHGHLAVTENQIIRLIHIFDTIGERAVGTKCPAVATIIQASENIAISDAGYYRDAEIIHCSQRLMELEIENYTRLYNQAEILKEELAAEFLALAVKEEKTAHARLTEISLSSIYFDAAS